MKTLVKPKYITVATALFIVILAALFVGFSFNTVYIYPDSGSVKIRRETFKSELKPFDYKGYTYLPASEIFPAMGYEIKWDGDTFTLHIEKNGKSGTVCDRSNVYKAGDKEVSFKAPAMLYERRMYVHTKMLEKITGRNFEIKGSVALTVKDEIVFYANKHYFDFNGERFEIADTITRFNDKIYIPAEYVLECLGYAVTKNDDMLFLEKFGNNYEIGADFADISGDKYNEKNIFYHDTLFVSEDIFELITAAEVKAEGMLRENPYNRRAVLDDITPTDEFRRASADGTFNGVTVAGDIGMELVSIGENSAAKYADVINKIANAMKNVNVYNILVPSSAEFYSPKDYNCTQYKGIRRAYEQMSDKVVTINAYAALKEKADENIFFRTDHHWTQRGAYYAYREFANQKGMHLPSIDTFEQETMYGFLGSFEGFTRDTPGSYFLQANPDILEKFYPAVDVNCTFYGDEALQNKLGSGELVAPYRSYMAFLEGDHPITEIKTDVKNGKTLVIVKESYGNSFATWAVNHYETIYAVDPREFNGFDGKTEKFNLLSFYEKVKFDDLIIMNYPVSAISTGIHNSILQMIGE